MYLSLVSERVHSITFFIQSPLRTEWTLAVLIAAGGFHITRVAYQGAGGAPLARMEGQVAINTLLGRAGDLRVSIDVSAIRWRHGLVIRGMKSLPVTVATWI